MIKLKDLIIKYDGLLSDEAIILEWFKQNNEEEKGLDMISLLAQSKIKKLQIQLDYVQTWGSSLIDMTKVLKPKEYAEKLNKIIKCQVFGFDLPKDLLDWARQNIPKMKLPNFMFMDTVNWLKEKYGILFEEQLGRKVINVEILNVKTNEIKNFQALKVKDGKKGFTVLQNNGISKFFNYKDFVWEKNNGNRKRKDGLQNQ